MVKLLFNLFIFIGLLIVVPQARAATYDFPNGSISNIQNAQKITNAENYHYVYGFLGKGQDTLNYYTFDLIDYEPNMQISLMLPESEKNTKFRPGMVLINSYLPATGSQLPYGLPYGISGAVYEWSNETSFYNKEIMQNLITGPTYNEGLTAGNYKIAIYDPTGTGGRYVLRVGAKENQKSLLDMVKLLWVIFRASLNIY